MILNKDYKDILHALSERKVKFLMVGAYAMDSHIPLHILSIPDLIKNKRSSGRIKDLADVQSLENNLKF